MKHSIFLLMALFVFAPLSAQWIIQSTPVTARLLSVHFVNETILA
jgi:hypothetical protein